MKLFILHDTLFYFVVKMRRSIILFTLLAFITLISFVNADWVFEEVSGDWNYYSLVNWESPYNYTVSWFEYNQTLENFQKWEFGVKCIDACVGGYWESSSVYQNFYAELNHSDTKIGILISHSRKIHFFGVQDWRTDIFVWRDNNWEWRYGSLINAYVQVYIWRNTTDTVYITYQVKYSQSDENYIFGEDLAFNVGSDWFSNVTLNQRVEKDLTSGGYTGGSIKGEKLGEEITTGTSGISNPKTGSELPLAQAIAKNIWSELGNLFENFKNALPEEVRNFLDQAGQAIYGFGNLAYALFSTLFGLLVNNLPLILGVYGVYLIYIIVKCVEGGDFSPLFEHFFKIAGLLFAIGNTVLNVIKTIISLIKWW
ncbi:hypothetical protein DRJ16_00240 [Candidatus Woesearchaeota archaeon]|nr:MAG: hypothetical protein DRJ16_00240 [Candidatus Woesearchaeota archaeon]